MKMSRDSNDERDGGFFFCFLFFFEKEERTYKRSSGWTYYIKKASEGSLNMAQSLFATYFIFSRALRNTRVP